MAINIELAEQVLDAVAREPERHDQTTWRNRYACGTTMCIGGWAVLKAGGKFVSDDPDNDYFAEVVPEPGDDLAVINEDDGVRWVDVEDRARRVLNLDIETAHSLFYGFGDDNAGALTCLRELVEIAKSVEAAKADPPSPDEPVF